MGSSSLAGTSSSKPKLSPRIATLEDMPQILEIAQRFWGISPWQEHTFDPNKVAEVVEGLMSSDEGVVFIHQYGIIGGYLVPVFFNGDNIANELFWFADKGGRELLEAFEDWASFMSVKKIILSSLAFGTERDRKMTNLYSRYGYSPIEMHFAKEVA